MHKINFKKGIVSIEEPNICPHCHVVNDPHFQNAIITKDDEEKDQIISIWNCASNGCRRSFVAEYQIVSATSSKFIRFLNGNPKGPDWPKPIIELKSGESLGNEKEEESKFIKTYLQSLRAEHSGLDEIAGMGYRKAIEYLIKDWAIQTKPGDKEKIQASWFGKVIGDYFTGDLKGILERATWLGNDQAHYIKLFQEYDISVLKELIGLIMVELDREHKKRHFIETIKSRKM